MYRWQAADDHAFVCLVVGLTRGEEAFWWRPWFKLIYGSDGDCHELGEVMSRLTCAIGAAGIRMPPYERLERIARLVIEQGKQARTPEDCWIEPLPDARSMADTEGTKEE